MQVLAAASCASCEGSISGRPVYYMDETYCCRGCVQGGPCVCTYEQGLADDGVDGLGLPFATHVDSTPEREDDLEVYRRSRTPVSP